MRKMPHSGSSRLKGGGAPTDADAVLALAEVPRVVIDGILTVTYRYGSSQRVTTSRWPTRSPAGAEDPVDKTVPTGLDVHLVCDNLATHKAAAIQDWLARRPRPTCTSARPASPGSTRSSAGSAT
jgi:hypothetical protein